MATMRAQMSLNDGLGAVLKKINSALDSTLKSFEKMKDFTTGYLEAADTQINAQVQLRTILNNTGAEYSYNKLREQMAGGVLENDLALNTDGAMGSYADLTGSVDGAQLESTLSLDVSGAMDGYGALAAGLSGGQAAAAVQSDPAQAATAYDAVVAKASQIQSGGMYTDEAMIAGAAELAPHFTDAGALLSMMDTLSDYAAGMSGGGAVDSQAMAGYAASLGGILSGSYDAMSKKGLEFSDAQKAIVQGTATQEQIVAVLGAEYLDMSADMQAAAAINAVVAQSWGGLYETMSNTPQGELMQLNNALGTIGENVGAGIYPAVMDFVTVMQQNIPQISGVAMGLATVLGFAITLMAGLVEGALALGTAVSDNWSWIGPLIWGVVAALTAYGAYLAITNGLEMIGNIQKGIAAVQTYAHAAALGYESRETRQEALSKISATAAQNGFNAALLASPITWIVVGVIALVAGIMALCGWIAKTTGLAGTAFGVITGGINVVLQWFKNLGLTIVNIAIGIWNALGAVCSNIGTAFHNVIADIKSWFYGLLSTALTVVAEICRALNKLPFVEFDYSGITDKADEYSAKSAAALENKMEYKDVSGAFNEGSGTFDAFEEGWEKEAFAAGAAWGDGVADKVGGLFDGLDYQPGSIEDYTDGAMGPGGPPTEDLGYPPESIGDYGGFDLDDIAANTGAIADNTSGITDTLQVSGEDLKYLRDIAEREAVNRYTTAQITVEQHNENHIDRDADLDGILSAWTADFAEKLDISAEGVHL